MKVKELREKLRALQALSSPDCEVKVGGVDGWECDGAWPAVQVRLITPSQGEPYIVIED